MEAKQDDQKHRDRLRFRSWHRGTREMDLLLGRFADAHIDTLTPEQVTQYETILELSDPDLYNWIAGREAVPEEHDCEVLRLLMKEGSGIGDQGSAKNDIQSSVQVSQSPIPDP